MPAALLYTTAGVVLTLIGGNNGLKEQDWVIEGGQDRISGALGRRKM